MLMVARFAQFGMLFAFNVVASRALGPAGRGDYVVPATIAIVIGVITHLSIEGGLGRLLARGETDRAVATRLGVSASLAVGGLGLATYALLCVALQPALPGSISDGSLILAGAAIPFISSSFILATLLLRLGGVRVYGLTMALSASLQLGGIGAAALATELTPELVLSVVLAAHVLTTLGLLVALARLVGGRALRPMRPGALGRRVLGLSLRIHPAAVAIFLVMRLDLVIVGLIAGQAATGRYSVSKSVAEMAFLAASSLALAALHGQTQAEEDAALGHTVEQTRMAVAVSTVLALVLALTAYPLVYFLYGQEWTAAVVPLALLALGGVGLAIEAAVRGLLIRIAPLSQISLAATAALVLNVALAIAFIPTFGIVGAAVASVVGYWAAAAGALLLLRRHGGTPLVAVFHPPSVRTVRGLFPNRSGRAPVDDAATGPR